MDMDDELKRLQGIEREYDQYLHAQCESVGADTNVEGLENPRLALACRFALATRLETRDSCVVCGGRTVMIRGRHPGMPDRQTCPTCVTETLDDIHQRTSTDYNKTKQA